MENSIATIRAAASIRQRYFGYIYQCMKFNVILCSVISTVACLWICIEWRIIYDSNCYAQNDDYESIAVASGFT